MGSPTRKDALLAMGAKVCNPNWGETAPPHGMFVDHTGLPEEEDEGLPYVVMDRRLPVKDMVVLPGHYARYRIEPINFIVENELDFCRGNAVKYILRCDAKDGEQDLDKAIRYMEMYRQRHFRMNPNWWTKDGKPREAPTQATA